MNPVLEPAAQAFADAAASSAEDSALRAWAEKEAEAGTYGERFRPTDWLRERAAAGRGLTD